MRRLKLKPLLSSRDAMKTQHADLSWLTARPIAHRGLHDGNKGRWENTLTAFSRAIVGNYAIECDVHLSGDGVPVVFHDADLERLTGEKGMIHDRTAAQLSTIRIGGTQDHIPLLAQMLALVDGKVPLVIELKGHPGHDDGLVAAVARGLSGYTGHAAIMSFEHHLLRRCAKDAPGIPVGLTAEGVHDPDMEGHFSMLAHGIQFVSYNVHHLPNRFVSFVRQQMGLPVITWTVREPQSLKKTYDFADQATFEGFLP
jgi:glycerophosphoryl diester phosphodiesterase